MQLVERVDLTNDLLNITSGFAVNARQRKPGPPERIDGMTLGVVTINPGESPHNGEMHPDGDEILYVVSGRLSIKCDSVEEPLVLTAGEACIVRKGEWHKPDCLETTILLHITPGPNGEARF